MIVKKGLQGKKALVVNLHARLYKIYIKSHYRCSHRMHARASPRKYALYKGTTLAPVLA